VALQQDPVVDDGLDVPVEQPGHLVPHFLEDDVHEIAGTLAVGLCTDDAREKIAVLNQHLRVAGGDPPVWALVLVVGMRRVRADE